MIKSADLHGAESLMQIAIRKQAVAAQGVVPGALGFLERGAQGLGSLVRGTHGVVRAGSRAAGEATAQALGAGPGSRLLGKAIEYSPYAIGAYALNQALNDPVGNLARQKLDEFRAMRAQMLGRFDPSTGQWT